MTLGRLRELWRGPARYGTGTAAAAGVRRLVQTPGFRYGCVMRLCAFTGGLPQPAGLVLQG